METNAAAIQWYQESLSHNKKAQILVNNAAAQQTHWESLFPKENAQILKNDAAAHKKTWKSLPSKEKDRLLDTNATTHQTQCHQHLTEKEKKIASQIKSFAATLYGKIDLDQPTVEFCRNYFYKDPILALAYYNCCSIDPGAAIFNDNIGTSAMWDHISNLIASPNGQEETVVCQNTFKNLDLSHAKIVACASWCECI